MRLLSAALFLLYINYVPFHLLNEPHSHDAALPPPAMVSDSEGHHDPEHDGHHGHHVPHPSSEHSIQMLPKSKSLFICFAFLPAVTGIVLETPALSIPVPLIERVWPPGKSPPQPSQPRAPPLA